MAALKAGSSEMLPGSIEGASNASEAIGSVSVKVEP
jgi:hypothetical protein